MALFSSTWCTHKSTHIVCHICTCQHTNSLTHTKVQPPFFWSCPLKCWHSIYTTTSLKSGLYLLYLLSILISKIWTHTCTHTGIPSLYTIFCTEASWNFKIAWCTHSNRCRNPLYVLCTHILASFPASPSPFLTFSHARIAWKMQLVFYDGSVLLVVSCDPGWSDITVWDVCSSGSGYTHPLLWCHMTPASLALRELDTHWGMWDLKLHFNQSSAMLY